MHIHGYLCHLYDTISLEHISYVMKFAIEEAQRPPMIIKIQKLLSARNPKKLFICESVKKKTMTDKIDHPLTLDPSPSPSMKRNSHQEQTHPVTSVHM